jgi:hypothetical protein
MITYDYLKFNSLGIQNEPNSPGYHEIDFLLEVAAMIPKKMEDLENVDPEILASSCLAALFTVSRYHAEALAWCGWREVEAQSILGKLMIASEMQVTIRKDSVRSDQKYVDSQNKFKTAMAYTEFYSGLKKGFEAGHYWARSKEAAANAEMRKSGYDVHEQKNTIEQKQQQQSSELSFD